MPLKKGSPGCACCSNDCLLMPVDPAAPDAAFADLAAVQAAFSLRAGAWTDVSAAAGQLDLAAAGVQLLADAEPNYSPFGVTFTTYFKGRDGSVIRFFVGADADVSLSAEVTLGADCGELRFYEEALTGEARIGDVHIIRELRAEEWHRITLCYDPHRGYLTATITTLAGETWAYSVAVTSTGQAGYGLGTETDTAEFKTFAATATEHYLARDPAASCGDVLVVKGDVGTITTHEVQNGLAAAAFVEGYGHYTFDNWSWESLDFSFTTLGYPWNIYDLHIHGIAANSTAAAVQAAFDAVMAPIIPAYGATTTDVSEKWSEDSTPEEHFGRFVFNFTRQFPGAITTSISGGAMDGTDAIIHPLYPYLGDYEVQDIVVSADPGHGSWRLMFDGETTGWLAHDASQAAVQSALEALSNIGAGNCTVKRTVVALVGTVYRVVFQGDLLYQNLPLITAEWNPCVQQTATIVGNPQAGTWTLTLDTETTTALAWDCDADAVRDALELLSNIGAGNVAVTGTNPAFTITFGGALDGTDVSTLVAAHNFQACDCPYDSYTYEYSGACLKHCPTCDPSCALAGSPFSATLSSCDWDGPGYTFGDGTATGTGTLTHRTEIWTVPVVATATVETLATDKYYSLSIAGVEAVVTVTLVSGAYRLTLSTNGTNGGHVDFETLPDQIILKMCRYSDMVAVEVRLPDAAPFVVQIVTGLSTPLPPASLMVNTDNGDSTWISISATRHISWYASCPGCYFCTLCDLQHMPGDAIEVDLGPPGFLEDTGLFVAHGMCNVCTLIGGKVILYAIPQPAACEWVGAISICRCTDGSLWTDPWNIPKKYCGNEWSDVYLVFHLTITPYLAGLEWSLAIYIESAISAEVIDTATDHQVRLETRYKIMSDRDGICDIPRELINLNDPLAPGFKFCSGAFPSTVWVTP